MKKIFLCGIVLLVLLPVFASAATINAVSCSYADVLAAIASAQSGDTVRVPAGSCTWNSQLVITKGIILKGAGIGNTVIMSSYTQTGGSNQDEPGSYLVVYNPSSPALNEPFRLSGFTFDLASKCSGVQLRDETTSVISKIRVDHNRFINVGTPGIAIYVKGSVYGVADNNVAVDGYMRCNGLNEVTWKNFNFDYGSADNFYFENNSISMSRVDIIFYNECGARFCARYNNITATSTLFPMIDMHGKGGNGELDTMGGEVYGNTLNMGSYSGTFMDQRSGKALVYNNVITTSGSLTMKAREEELDSVYSPLTSPDGQPRHVSDSYYWSNTRNNGRISEYYIGGTVDYGGDTGVVPQIDRDVWFEPGLATSYVFTGTHGVGFGSLSSRPSTCTVGVAYWANDTKVLYRCNATNVWVTYYKPYTYPHPLRTDCANYPSLCDSGSSPPPPPVAIPGDLNGDRKVDISDLVIVASNFGKSSDFDSRANVVSSSPEVIDIADLSFVARRFTG